MHNRLKLLFVFSLVASFAAALRAQTAHWEPAGGSLAYGQASQLQLIFDGCAPKGQPTLPSINGLSLQFAGQSSQTSIMNGSISRSETLAYAVRPTRKIAITIPEFSVETDKGRIVVPSVNFSVGEATVANGLSLEAIANSSFTVPASVWVGEVFPIEYNLNVRQRNAPNVQNLLGSLLDWKPAPLVVEDWSKPAARDNVLNGETFINVSQKTRALATKGGPVTLAEGTQLVNIAKGVDFFGRYVLDQFSIATNHPTIEVKPLPSAPTGFNGAVGQFTLKSNVVPAVASVGEPITWTLTLTGTGNWPDISGLPARSVSKDFRTVQPQAHRTLKEGTLFEATLVEDVVLIPTKSGSYTLSPVTWSYFDPEKGEYQTVTTAPAVVTVTPAAETASSPSATSPSSQYGASAGPKPAAMPKGIPRDPLPPGESVIAPVPASLFAAALCGPVILLGLFWLWLAFHHAFASDPDRPRREAKKRLVETLDRLASTKDPSTATFHLLAWQRDAAVLWGLQSAVPSAAHFPPEEKRWIKLWTDSERALYRDATPLPPNWADEAREALTAKKIPGFPFWTLFRLKNLLPFAAVVAAGLLMAPPNARAEEGIAAYNRGDFATAEKTWRETVAYHPSNPTAHYNLSLALAQQDRWGEAAAHAAAAFAQKPADESLRWNLTFTLERAGYAPSVFSGFAAAHPPHRLARLFSPTQWQGIAVLAAGLGAAGSALFLLRGYGRRSRWLKVSAVVLVTLGSTLGTAAGVSLRVYSPVNDARAAIVWHATTLRSIPTEVETTQKTAAVSAGSVAVVDHHFIGNTWARLLFANGQTGWVRQEDLVYLWR